METISFGTPTGRSRIAAAAIDDAAGPADGGDAVERARRRCSRRRPRPRRAPIASTARAAVARAGQLGVVRARGPGDLLARRRRRSTCGSPSTPASTSSASAPCSRRRSRRNAYSWPFVSRVPTSATTGAAPATVRPARRRASGAGRRGRSASSSAVVSAKIRPATMTSWRSASAVATREVLLDDEDRQAVLREPPERLDEHLDDRRRQPLRRLVHDQQPRVGQQRPADGEHLLLAAGELRPARRPALRQAREQLVDRVGRPAVLAAAPGRHAQVLVDRERLEQPPALGHVADARARRPCRTARPTSSVALEADRAARGRRAHLHDRVAERRLAHAVAADDRDGLAAHLEAQALQDVGAAVEDVEVADRQQRGLGRRGRGGRGGGRLAHDEPSASSPTRPPR